MNNSNQEVVVFLNNKAKCSQYSTERMAVKPLAVWLLLLGTVVPPGCCQHWSFGLSPGGKRELDSFPNTLQNVVEELAHMEAPCRVLSAEEESPFAKLFRMKGLLGSAADGENGHRGYKK